MTKGSTVVDHNLFDKEGTFISYLNSVYYEGE